MKYFPLKAALICLVTAPILYTISLAALQSRLDRLYHDKVRDAMIRDASPLLAGSDTIEAQVGGNIRAFLKNDVLLKIGRPDISIFITTREGQLVYPQISGDAPKEMPMDEKALAALNYNILSRGLIPMVEVRLPHGSRIANTILLLYILVSMGGFGAFYRSGSRRAQQDIQERTSLIRNLQDGQAVHQMHLAELKREKQALFEKMRQLDRKYREDKKKAKINEEDMFEEIVHLEEELSKWQEVESEKEDEIETLRNRLQKYERRKSARPRRNDDNFIVKRFSALYKNIVMNRKAVSGFANLNEEQQIKAEEVILQLDRDPDKVIVKRKVFSGKKHRSAAFEVLFAYNGRLYFRLLEGGATEVLVIGTKNTQDRDMDFLHQL